MSKPNYEYFNSRIEFFKGLKITGTFCVEEFTNLVNRALRLEAVAELTKELRQTKKHWVESEAIEEITSEFYEKMDDLEERIDKALEELEK